MSPYKKCSLRSEPPTIGQGPTGDVSVQRSPSSESSQRNSISTPIGLPGTRRAAGPKVLSTSSLPMDARAESLPKETCAQCWIATICRRQARWTRHPLISTEIWQHSLKAFPERCRALGALYFLLLEHHPLRTRLVHGSCR